MRAVARREPSQSRLASEQLETSAAPTSAAAPRRRKFHPRLVFDTCLVKLFHLLLFVEEARHKLRPALLSSAHQEIHQIESLCLTGLQEEGRTATRALTTEIDSCLCVNKHVFAHFRQVRVVRNGPASVCETERVAIVCCAGPVMLSQLIY